jgi:25S rRNA (uracil2634-N3)-methyltransferase
MWLCVVCVQKAKEMRKDFAAKNVAKSKEKKRLETVAQRAQRELEKQMRAAVSPYTAQQRILLIGEGNFSFARSLTVKFGHGNNIVATSLDDLSALTTKYQDAKVNMRNVELSGALVLTGVDACALDKCKELKKLRFDRVVFNFPHTGSGISNTEDNIRDNRKMILRVLLSVTPFLSKKNAEVHITLKRGPPYDEWKLPQLCGLTPGLKYTSAFAFFPHLYPEYAHRRTIGFKRNLSASNNEEISQGATTFVLATPVSSSSSSSKKRATKRSNPYYDEADYDESSSAPESESEEVDEEAEAQRELREDIRAVARSKEDQTKEVKQPKKKPAKRRSKRS